MTSMLVGPGRYNRAKYDSYECGIEPTPQPVGGGRFPVKYYITAMLFIVFDIEIVFLYPWAVTFDQMGTFALVEMVLFIVTVVRRLLLRAAARRTRLGLTRMCDRRRGGYRQSWVLRRSCRAGSC